VPDTSTFGDARAVLDKYNLWDKFPAAASAHLRDGGQAQETPKAFTDAPLHTVVVVPGDAACLGAHARAQELGFNALILTSMLEGEARDAGTFFAAIAREVSTFGRPFAPPFAVIAGGENVVTIDAGPRGAGGPNQEFALSAALGIAGLERALIASVDTDGSDGPTDFAGGIVDGTTRAAATEKGLDPSLALRAHDACTVLQAIGDAIATGPTGTNVNDLKLLLVS
jgi:glycerate-2-kinase